MPVEVADGTEALERDILMTRPILARKDIAVEVVAVDILVGLITVLLEVEEMLEMAKQLLP